MARALDLSQLGCPGLSPPCSSWIPCCTPHRSCRLASYSPQLGFGKPTPAPHALLGSQEHSQGTEPPGHGGSCQENPVFLALFLLFFGILHLDAYIFPFLLCFSLFCSQLFVRPPQTAILLFCISFWPRAGSFLHCGLLTSSPCSALGSPCLPSQPPNSLHPGLALPRKVMPPSWHCVCLEQGSAATLP